MITDWSISNHDFWASIREMQVAGGLGRSLTSHNFETDPSNRP